MIYFRAYPLVIDRRTQASSILLDLLNTSSLIERVRGMYQQQEIAGINK